MHEIVFQGIDGFFYLGIQFRVGNHFLDAGSHVDHNHGDGMSLRLKGWEVFRLQNAGSIQEMTHPLEQIKCFLCIFLVAGSQCIFRHGNGGKAFRKDISSFPERSAVGHDFEIHSSIRIEAVVFNEIQCQFGCFQPFRILFRMVVSKRADEGKTSLEPH